MLVSSPTGTGKTLTGFLAIINELFLRSKENGLEDKIECVYISPLKALANDINRNLGSPFSYPQRKFDILSRGACVAERPILMSKIIMRSIFL